MAYGEPGTDATKTRVFRRNTLLFATDREGVPASIATLSQLTEQNVELAPNPAEPLPGILFEGQLSHLTPPFDRYLPRLTALTARGLETTTVVSLEPRSGAGEVAEDLRNRLFPKPVIGNGGEAHTVQVVTSIHAVTTGWRFLVPLLRSVLSWEGQEVTRVLTVCSDRLPKLTTVTQWGRVAGYRGRDRLARLCRTEGLPKPKKLLSWMRLLAAVDYAHRQRRMPTRRQVCEHFRYSNPNYFSKHVKRISRRSWSQLTSADVTEAVQLISL